MGVARGTAKAVGARSRAVEAWPKTWGRYQGCGQDREATARGCEGAVMAVWVQPGAVAVGARTKAVEAGPRLWGVVRGSGGVTKGCGAWPRQWWRGQGPWGAAKSVEARSRL